MRIPALLVLAAIALPAAQVPDGSGAAFEAASIKRNRSGDAVAGLRRSPGGRFEATNIQLSSLVSFAYQLQPFELVGGPDWLMSDRWDVLAKAVGDPPPTPQGTPDAMALAMRTLLADRFKLVLRRETREVDVYQLVMSRGDKQPGPGLRRSAVDCLAVQKAIDDAARGGPPASSPNTADRLVCGLRFNGRRLQHGGRSMDNLATFLVPLTQRRVVNRTGLSGNWEFDIAFRAENPPPQAESVPEDAELPSMFTALQEQLGLKLEPVRMAMPVMVVDSVERPVED